MTLTRNTRITAAAAMILCLASAQAADVAAGKATAQARCSKCHDADDWEGESAASLASLMRDIIAGKVKHKQALELTPADIDNIAAYWGQGG